MTTYNVGGIWDAYLQGANFAATSLDRAEKAEEERKKKDAAEFGSRLYNLTTRVDPKSGIPLFKNEEEIYNSPEFTDLLNNTKLGREIINEGMPDNGYTAKIKRAIPVEGGGWAPEIGWYDEDGVEQSAGPMSIDPKTGKRSNSPDSTVVAPSLPGWLHVGLSKIGEYSPEYADRISNGIKNAGVHSSLAQLRGLPEDQRGPIVDKLMQIGVSPEQITHAMTVGLPVTKQRLDGTVEEIKPGGSTTLRRDPTLFKNVTQPTYDAETGLMTRRKRSLSDADIQIETAHAPQKRVNRAGDIESEAEVRDRVAGKYAPAETDREVKRQSALSDAKHDIGLRQNAEEGLIFDQAVANIGSGDPKREANGLRDLGKLVPDTTVREKVAREAKARGLLINNIDKTLSNGLSAFDSALEQGIGSLNQSEADGLYAGLVRRSQEAESRGDKAEALRLGVAARHVQQAILGPRGDAGGKGEAPKPAEFNPTAVKQWTDGMPEEGQRRVHLQGEQLFRDALTVFPAAKGSQEETDLNMAVGEALRENRPNHVLPLVNWTRLQKDPAYAAGTGSSREFIDEIHTPIVELSKQQGLSMSPRVLSQTERLAVGLKARGIANSDAVTKAIELEKKPELVDKISRLLPAPITPDNPNGATPEQREKIFLDTLAADLKTDRARNLKSTFREGADYTFGGGMMR